MKDNKTQVQPTQKMPNRIKKITPRYTIFKSHDKNKILRHLEKNKTLYPEAG